MERIKVSFVQNRNTFTKWKTLKNLLGILVCVHRRLSVLCLTCMRCLVEETWSLVP